MASLPPPPSVSKTTIPITGLLVDIYGLTELAPGTTHVSCLWLHHPRTRDRGQMADIAARCVAAYNAAATPHPTRGLIAAAFDQRNHGSREVHPPAIRSWRDGNPEHAQDMFGTTAGTVVDTSLLIDALGSYVFHRERDEKVVDQHLVLGVSLGGHSGWQLMFADPRVTAGVLVIGCPDFIYLLSDRARRSKLPTYKAADGGASFPGSTDFPRALIQHCALVDPKALLFGAGAISHPASRVEQDRLRPLLDARVRGKRFLICSGGDDKLVPYSCSEPFLDFFKSAAETWYRDGRLQIDDKVYPGKGHEFSSEMVEDAVKFVVDTVQNADEDGGRGAARI